MRVQKESTLNAYTAWYPPVQQTLLCLSKMYRCIDARIFGGLAQEAVSAATATAQAASRLVAKRAEALSILSARCPSTSYNQNVCTPKGSALKCRSFTQGHSLT